MADCLWCKQEQQSSRRLEPEQPRECPICAHVFKGNGWDGIDAHWRSKHARDVRYEEFWEGLCERHRRRKEPEPRKMTLSIDAIRLDFQLPECLFEEVVREYFEQLHDGETLRSVRVRYDGNHYFLEDGFHRVEAARRFGLEIIEAEVLPGTLAAMEAEFDKAMKRALKRLARDVRKSKTLKSVSPKLP